MMEASIERQIHTPLTYDSLVSLKAGEKVLIQGVVYTARDKAHQRMIENLSRWQNLPFDPAGQIIYYMGPSPTRPGDVIGSAGPTTSSRMDPYTIPLLEHGLKGMIGKGARSAEVRNAMMAFGAVYFGAVGGVGALIARTIKSVTRIAYEDLGPEAILRLHVEMFPVLVVNDLHGNDLFQQGRSQYIGD